MTMNPLEQSRQQLLHYLPSNADQEVIDYIRQEKQEGAALMTLLENGAWAACRAPQSPAKVFQTEQAARDYLSDCESVIIIDL